MKPLAPALAAGLTAAYTALQTTAGTTAAVQTVTAIVGGATMGGIMLYLVRRVNAIPAEESLKRHEAMNAAAMTQAANYDRLDEGMQRMEARLMGAIEGASKREAEERHRIEARLLDVEREIPRRRRGA